jgi:proline iminopeptidase
VRPARAAAALLGAALVSCGGVAPAPTPPRGEAPPAAGRLAPGAHRIEIPGAVISIHVAGTGPLCLALPGGPGIDAAYLRSPAERHLTLIYVDPVGTGASSRLPEPAGYGRARAVADLEKLRAALGLERVCLLGHSHGGTIALLYALAHPARVSRLILYDTTARVDDELRERAWAELERRRDASWYADVRAGFAEPVETDDDATRAMLKTAPAYFFDWDARAAEHAAALGRSRVTAAAMKAEAGAAPVDLRRDLGRIRAPTLVLVGRHDFVCSLPFARELATGIPGARLVVFARSGHFAHLEEPEAFAAAISAFVAGRGPRPAL